MSEYITGYIELISYYSEENGWTVARFRDSATDDRITVVGSLAGIHEGESLRLAGSWKQHPRFGTQFSVESFQYVNPETEAGIERYLGSGLIRGIGPKTAERIVALFGTQTLKVIEKEPDRLYEVSGLGAKKIAVIREAWEEQRGIRKLMIFLQSYGIGSSIALRIYRRYKDQAVEYVSRNPYRLAEEVRGIGFNTADKIASSLGFARDNHLRIESGLLYCGDLAVEKGHTCLPRKKYLEHAGKLLELAPEILDNKLSELASLGKLVLDSDQENGEEYIYPVMCFWAEMTVADGLSRIVQCRLEVESAGDGLSDKRKKALISFQRETGISLSGEQKEAVIGTLERGIAVITGGPGTGKTTLISALVRILEQENLATVLAAPTGRAAKKMSESAGVPASTIHRLLGWSFNDGRFLHNADRPLKGDAFIIDEVSMVDIMLFASLVEALPAGAMLVLVGDADQLPSIGPGKVLTDLIASCSVPVYRLGVIFRQADRSAIIRNAHRVREGKRLLPSDTHNQGKIYSEVGDSKPDDPEQDFYLVNQPDPVLVREMVVRMAAERLETRFGIDPGTELQVITPMNRGACGTRELNAALQDALNPQGRKIIFARDRFRVGDRVMQIRNDYEKDVYNGDVGVILSCDEESQTVNIDFDGRIVAYEGLELDDLNMAYAVTVHKSQGSEYPAVIITICNEHYVMLQRNLLYTAISRGQRLVVLIGDPRAISHAISNARIQFRYSRLAIRLKEAVTKYC